MCGESGTDLYGTDQLYHIVKSYPQKTPFMYVRRPSFLDSLNMYGIISIGTTKKGIIGYFTIQYLSQYFPYLINPVLPREDSGMTVDFWVYAPYYPRTGDYSAKVEPTYEQWIFQSPDATVEMTEEIFKQQVEVIFQ